MACPCIKSFPKGEERVDDDVFYTYPHFVGNNVLLCGRKNSRFPFHCMIGPEWPCMLLTYALICVPTVYFVKNVATIWSTGLVTFCAFTGFITLCMFSATACSDPGIVWVNKKQDDADPEGQLSSLDNTMECGRCNVDRPRTATHCYECGLCVDQLDHHCPWTGKCIAKKNIQNFRIFLFLLTFHIVLVCIICIYTFSENRKIVDK